MLFGIDPAGFVIFAGFIALLFLFIKLTMPEPHRSIKITPGELKVAIDAQAEEFVRDIEALIKRLGEMPPKHKR